MVRDRAHELQRANLATWMAGMAGASAGASLFEADGVRAAVLPACSDRSVPNSVTYRDAAALEAALPALADAYEDAGVRAWTVWTPDFDAEAIAALERAGHAFDGKPAAMTLDLAALRAVELGDLDWDSDGDPAEVGRLNDLAYGFDGGSFAAAIGESPASGETRWYQARVAGDPACVMQTIDLDGDCGVYLVATDPRRRGLGLATRLMSAALEAARDRGCMTSTLQASPMGFPIYRRLGYETFFRLHLYERRK
jgi:GNAT superfamily N-acetyltransferase